MESTHLQAADAAYAEGDWTTAAREYLAASAADPQGSGYAYHRAGNALMRLKRLEDACAVYERALLDPDYGEAAAVACNLGMARTSLGAFEEAAAAFERAVADVTYAGRHRALQGLAGAYYQLGRIEDAAEAYRKAALDEGNPDPGKALNNLGLCFVALDRPEDAVEAYRAAMDLETYQGRGRAAANLGMAYAALGMQASAAECFDRARDEFGYELTPQMESAYKACAETETRPVQVEGWSTGELPPVMASSPSAAPVASGDDEVESRFFTMTDEEMREVDRAARRGRRQRGRSEAGETAKRPLWFTLLMWGAVAIVTVGLVVGAYLAGLGYPTQQMTVNGLLEAYGAGEAVDDYWVAVPTTDVDKAMSGLPTTWKSYQLGGVTRSARTSQVPVTITLEQGGVVTYDISLAREGVGWKVNGVTNSFSSMSGGK